MAKTKESREVSNRLEVHQRIINVRGQRVIIDADLAKLYGTSTKRLKEQLKEIPIDFQRISSLS